MCFRHTSKNKFTEDINKKDEKDEKAMATSLTKYAPRRISASEFIKEKPDYEIHRIGTTLAFIKNDKAVPVNSASIYNIKKHILSINKPVKIFAHGVSRAQIGRIASHLSSNSGKSVFIRRVPNTVSSIARIQNYEILIGNGAMDVE